MNLLAVIVGLINFCDEPLYLTTCQCFQHTPLQVKWIFCILNISKHYYHALVFMTTDIKKFSLALVKIQFTRYQLHVHSFENVKHNCRAILITFINLFNFHYVILSI